MNIGNFLFHLCICFSLILIVRYIVFHYINPYIDDPLDKKHKFNEGFTQEKPVIINKEELNLFIGVIIYNDLIFF